MSSIGEIKAYLEAKNFDFSPLIKAEADNLGLLPVAKARLAAAQENKKTEELRIAEQKQQAAEELQRAELEFLNKYCSRDPFDGEWMGTHRAITPGKPDFDPERLSAKLRWDEATEKYEKIEFARASNSEVLSSVEEVRACEEGIENARRAGARARDLILAKKSVLPAGIAELGIGELEKVVAYADGLDGQDSGGSRSAEEDENLTLSEYLGIVRGEIPWLCESCEDGYLIHKVSQNIDLIVDDEIAHGVCYHRSLFSDGLADRLAQLLPASHRHHRIHDLKPWVRSPISQERQGKLLAKLPSCAEEVRGWLMLGPAGSSKSTYAAAAVMDMLSLRVMEHRAEVRNLNYHRLKVPAWLREMEAWESRDFGDDTVSPPSLLPRDITSEMERTGFTPILWLEELDKFVATKTRVRHLFTLIDAVYEAQGTIIATANDKRQELRALVGDPIWRRLTGENDDPEKFWLLDLWAEPKTKKKSPA
ncbi:MAG: hypothetical protein PW735_08265 [Acidobacteriaceae bacterium]|nr:hypothetical protein [Acidobacteriaceae bacterium]